jgi:PKHD-type hydroxylase
MDARVYTDVFTARELERIREECDAAQLQPATVEGDTPELRKGSVAWLATPWLSARLGEAVATINEAHFGFHLKGLEPLQYARYAEGDHFDWHVDMGHGNQRKLSLTVQLSDPSEYAGGDLVLRLGSRFEAMERAQGAVIAFPSWVPHCVEPVRQGVRRGLVAWAHGPAFL